MLKAEPMALGAAASPTAGRGEAICLFAFAGRTGAVCRPLPEDTLGPRLALHCLGSVAALVGIVRMADYCGLDGERHLADIAWLAPRVRRHAELVEWAMHASSVFPVPFGTLFTSLDSLSALMRAHETTIVGFLNEVMDKQEWDLCAGARFDSPEILDRLACIAWPGWQEMSKGARYLRLCRDRDALVAFGCGRAASFVGDFVAELRPLAAAVRQLSAARGPDSLSTEPVARYALLVPKTAVPALRERVRQMAVFAARRHLAIELSGPWPPFSFRPDLNAPNERRA